MYGLYRPLFGHYTPNHRSLFQIISGLDQRARFKALTVGSAPNVPFVNLRFLSKDSIRDVELDQGFAMNAGARFVTLGFWAVLVLVHARSDYGRSFQYVGRRYRRPALANDCQF